MNLGQVAKAINGAADDLAAFNNERMAEHYLALAEHHKSVPTPSYLRGRQAAEFRAWHNQQADIAMAKRKELTV